LEALVIHLADGWSGSVLDRALEQAIGWGELLESHARRIYSCSIDPAVAHARALARRIASGDVSDNFTLRDVYGRHWALLSDNRQALMAVDELIELGWLRAERQETRGRPKVIHRINPAALAMPI